MEKNLWDYIEVLNKKGGDMEKRQQASKMSFSVGQVRQCLRVKGRVYTVRAYGPEDFRYADGPVFVANIGLCHRVRVKEINTRQDLERFLPLSGFTHVNDWWFWISKFCHDRRKWLYLVHTSQPQATRKSVLVCGGRDWTNRDLIRKCLLKLQEAGFEILIHGAARGADRIAGEEAKIIGFQVKVFPAEWEKLGKKAGIIRNNQMLDERPDLVLAFHSDLSQSVGTKHCIGEAKRRGIRVIVRNGNGQKPAF